MIKRMKKRTFAGSLCQQVVWNSGRGPSIRPPRIRFKSEEERAEHRRQIARRKHALKINNSFTTAGFWCTFTFPERMKCIHGTKPGERGTTSAAA